MVVKQHLQLKERLEEHPSDSSEADQSKENFKGCSNHLCHTIEGWQEVLKGDGCQRECLDAVITRRELTIVRDISIAQCLPILDRLKVVVATPR